MNTMSVRVTAICLAMAGCTGSVQTTRAPQIADGIPLNGVLYYGYKVLDKKTVLDRIRHDKTGDITHSMYEPVGSARYCEPVIVVEQVPVADYAQPYLIHYKPALFETRKFAVTLDKGMLSAVNSESTPGHKSAVEALQVLATVSDTLASELSARSEANEAKLLHSLEGANSARLSIRCSAKA